MFALVESGSITKMLSGKRGITLGDVQYPQAIFTLWSAAEREAIGIYEVEYDNTNKKEEQWYINTDQSFAFADNTVTASYGSATAKAHADTLFTAQNEIDGLGTEGEVKTEGLKTQLIRQFKQQAAGELQNTDWYVIRKADAGTAVPSAITNAADTPALETLYTYTEQEDGSVTRPLGELPRLDS